MGSKLYTLKLPFEDFVVAETKEEALRKLIGKHLEFLSEFDEAYLWLNIEERELNGDNQDSEFDRTED